MTWTQKRNPGIYLLTMVIFLPSYGFSSKSPRNFRKKIFPEGKSTALLRSRHHGNGFDGNAEQTLHGIGELHTHTFLFPYLLSVSFYFLLSFSSFERCTFFSNSLAAYLGLLVFFRALTGLYGTLESIAIRDVCISIVDGMIRMGNISNDINGGERLRWSRCWSYREYCSGERFWHIWTCLSFLAWGKSILYRQIRLLVSFSSWFVQARVFYWHTFSLLSYGVFGLQRGFSVCLLSYASSPLFRCFPDDSEQNSWFVICTTYVRILLPALLISRRISTRSPWGNRNLGNFPPLRVVVCFSAIFITV